MSADGAEGSRPDAAAILDDVVSLIGSDVSRLKEIVSKTERVLTGEEARILSGYAQALGNVAKARKAADEDPMTPEDWEAIEDLKKMPGVVERLKAGGR